MKASTSKIYYHIVFCTKYRRKVINPEIEIRVKELLKQSEDGFVIKELEVMPDHVHCFVEVTSTEKSPHQIVARLKGYSSRFLRKEFKELKSKLPAMWTRSYYIVSVGHVSKETIEQYIKNQKNV